MDDGTEGTLELNLPLVLPAVQGERDQCVAQLLERLEGRRGISRAHLEQQDHAGPFVLCVYYTPTVVTLGAVQRLVEQTGAAVTKRYRHETLWLTGMDCADCAASIDIAAALGVMDVAVSQWLQRVHERGVGRLRSRPAAGPAPKLSAAQLAQHPAVLERRAEAYSFHGQVWTRKRVAKIVRSTFGGAVHSTTG